MERESDVFTKITHRTPSDGAGRLERPMFDQMRSWMIDKFANAIQFDKPGSPKFDREKGLVFR